MGLYYLQSRYYNPTIGRFLNADALISTGQGVLGNNMFAYCRNNPIVLEDATGTADRACIYAESRIDDEPWRDHSPGGGGIPRRNYSSGSNYYGEVADKFYTVRLLRCLGAVADALWDAYVHSNELQVQQQYQQDMTIKAQWEDIVSNPVRSGDFIAMTISNIGTYCAYVSFVANPALGAGVLLVLGAGASIWSTLRYYGVISE